ncbi:MAG: type IX secretion system membrane protein PorP/SprF [Bacteroidales bacterium]|jgi:type IX secretion system PorP/SprF family membrane protein|nr:type IX secretion system membrane protein PorP/SprF [Bacteroidales bacterium]
MKSNKVYILLFFAIVLIITKNIKAQSLPIHEQYVFDYSLENPSFIGLTDATIIKLSHRQQWFGVKDPPNTTFALARHRFKDTNLGLGGYIYSDQNGPNSRYGIQVSGSYHLMLKSNRTRKHILSFGLSFKTQYHLLDESNFERDIYDPIIKYGKEYSIIFNSNAGILYSTTRFFAGYSIDNLLPFSDKLYKSKNEPKPNFLHNFHLGKVWEILDFNQIRVSLSYKSDFKIQHQVEGNLRYYYLYNQSAKSKHVRYQNEIWGGVNFKQTLDRGNLSPLSVAPVIGYTHTKYSIALLYEITLSPLQKYNYGTMQILLAFKLIHTDWKYWNDFKVPNFYYDF